jgi:PAS domain S-box-containing protein
MVKENEILQTLADGVMVIDKNFKIISFSEGAERITGYTLEEVIGRNCEEIFKSDMCGEECPVKITLNSGEITSCLQFHIQTKDKKQIPIIVNTSPLKDREGKIIGAIQVFRNIAEVRFLTEEILREKNKLQAILNSIADGVFTVDREWKITSFNKSAEKITGISSKYAIGKKCFEIFRSDICQKNCPLQRTLKDGKTIFNFELEILTKNRGKIPISVSTGLLKDEQNRIIGGVETFRDLSEIKELKDEIKGKYSFQNIIGKNKKMQEIFDLIERIKDLDSTVLITGETGTGKELVARAIHYNSTRKDKPFIAVNCGALPDTLLESELFGHIKGAFTDAKSDRIGRFELANYGTIFLDEIGEASQNVQVKLLRVIETGEFEPVGSSKTKKVNVRIIAATNKDLKERIKEGKFREDLYYRLNVIRIHLPELRERSDDIPLLVEHFIEKFNEKFKKKIKKVSDEVMDILLDYPFPGNVRELENAIEHSFVHCRGTIILKEHLPEEIKKFGEITKETFSEHPSLKDAEKEVIIQALKKNNYEIGKTAKYLGISRQTLWRKMKKLGSVI